MLPVVADDHQQTSVVQHTKREEGLQPGGPLVAANLVALRVVNQIDAVGAAGQEPAHLIALQNRTVIQVIRRFGNAKVGPGAVRADAQHGLGNQSVLIVALVCAEIEVAAALAKVGVDRKVPRLRYVIGEGKAGLPHRARRGVGQGVFQRGVLQKRLGHLVVVRVGHRIIRDNAAKQQRVPDDIGNVHCLHRDIPRRGLPVFQVKPHTAGTAERRGADAPAVEVVTCVKNRHPVVVGERQHARLTARRRQGQHTAVVADEIQRVVYDQRRGRKLGAGAVHLIGLPGGKVGFVDGAVIKAAETVLAA